MTAKTALPQDGFPIFSIYDPDPANWNAGKKVWMPVASEQGFAHVAVDPDPKKITRPLIMIPRRLPLTRHDLGEKAFEDIGGEKGLTGKVKITNRVHEFCLGGATQHLAAWLPGSFDNCPVCSPVPPLADSHDEATTLLAQVKRGASIIVSDNKAALLVPNTKPALIDAGLVAGLIEGGYLVRQKETARGLVYGVEG